MAAIKTNTIERLQREILSLQGFRHALHSTLPQPELGPVKKAFPNNVFPCGAVHEFVCAGAEDTAATTGFISGIVASFMQGGGALVWISSSQTIFPPAVASFNIAPHKIIFIHLQHQKDILWTMEEALKCDGLAAVIADVKELSFITSRRLQLATENSGVTAFVLHHHPRNLQANACVARWKISSLLSIQKDRMPGVGAPQWQVELLKIRNGKPGKWQLQWINGNFRPIYMAPVSIIPEQQKKAG